MLLSLRVFWSEYMTPRGVSEAEFTRMMVQKIHTMDNPVTTNQFISIYQFLVDNTIWFTMATDDAVTKPNWKRLSNIIVYKLKHCAAARSTLYQQVLPRIPIGLCIFCCAYTTGRHQICKRCLVPFMMLHRYSIPHELQHHIMSFIGTQVNGSYH